MKAYAAFPHQCLPEQAPFADLAEHYGYAGVLATENRQDPFCQVAAAAKPERSIALGIAVTALLARHPVPVAYACRDVQASCGRPFILGIGTQLDVHLRSRYGLPTEDKHDRLVEAVACLREIWAAWSEDREPCFEGLHVSVTSCPSSFRPQLPPPSRPKIYLLCVSNADVRAAERIGVDGIFTHPAWPPHSVVRLARRLRASAGSRHVEVVAGGIVASGADDAACERSRAVARGRIGQYWMHERYDALYDAAGLREEIHELRARAARSALDWSDPWVDSMYRRFVCDAPFDRLADALLAHHGATVDAIFPNVVSALPALLPAEVVRALGTAAVPA